MSERLVLVTGATGALGPAVVRAALKAGYAVRALALDEPEPDVVPADVDIRIGDICDAAGVRAALDGVETVVHLAALLHQFDSRPGLEQEFERVNVGGTENVLRAAVDSGVRRVVFLSTIAVYGPSSGRLMDEDTPPSPETAYARTKLAAEQVVLSARSGGRAVGTVLRAAAVYGPRVTGNYRRLADSVLRHRFVPIGAGLNRRTLVHETDLARAVILAADHPNAAGSLFNVTDGGVHSLAEIISAIYRAAGRRDPRFHLPIGAARSAARLCEGTFGMLGLRPPVNRELVEKYTEDVAVDGSRMQRVLGFSPSMGLEAGWKETIATLVAQRRYSASKSEPPC